MAKPVGPAVSSRADPGTASSPAGMSARSLLKRTAVFLVLFVLPVVEFMVEQRLRIASTDSLLVIAVLIAVSIAAAVVTVPKPVFYLLLVPLFTAAYAPHFRDLVAARVPLGYWTVAFGFLIAMSLLAWRMRDSFASLIIVVGLASWGAGSAEALFGPPLLARVASSAAEAGTTARHRVVLYLLLDSYMGPAGFPDEVPEAREAVRSIRETFGRFNFTLYERAFTNYPATRDSIPSLLNYRIDGLDQVRDVLTGAQGFESYRIRENVLFDQMIARGFAIQIYQSSYATFEARVLPLKRVTYDWERVGTVQSLGLPMRDRLLIGAGRYLNENFFLAYLAERLRLGVANYRLVRFGMPSSMPAFEELRRDVLAVNRDTLFFAHLIAPHAPYVYRKDGSLRGAPAFAFFQSFPEDAAPDNRAYSGLHAAFAAQVEFLNSQLSDLFAAMDQRGLLSDALIVVHGDHGAKLLRMSAAPGRRAVLENYSAVLAVRQPGSTGSRTVESEGSLASFLHAELQPGTHPPTGPKFQAVYAVDSQGKTVPVAVPPH